MRWESAQSTGELGDYEGVSMGVLRALDRGSRDEYERTRKT